MSRALRTRLLINAAALLLLLVLFGGDLSDGLRARGAPAAALLRMPNLAFASGALLVGLAAAGVSVWGWWKGREDDFRGYRLLPIAMSVLVFVNLFVLADERPPFQSHEVAAAALGHLEERASYLGEAGTVPTAREVLEPILAELGQPPYLAYGQAPGRWDLIVRTGCSGPLDDVGTLATGTLVYCAAPDASRAWVTAVGLPWNQRFGSPQWVSTPRGVLVAVVEPAPPPAPPEGLQPLPPLRTGPDVAWPGADAPGR